MKTIERVFETLKEQGLIPSMKEYGIAFRYQMTNFIYMPDKEDGEFFNMLIPGIYDVSEENEYDVLRAINSVNNAMKVVKIVINNDSVWVCFESELSKDASVDELVPFAVATLFQARVRFYDALKIYRGESVIGVN